MLKLLSFITALAICLSAGPFLGVLAEEGVFYARISDFTAVYDKNTEEVEFCVELDGSVLEAEEFIVRIYCEVFEPEHRVWEENQSINTYGLSFGACLKDGNKLKGALPLDKERFTSEYYRNFRISVRGKTVESGGNLYYTLDSADIPISPKAAYAGEGVTVIPQVLPAQTAIGGYVLLRLTVKDIPDTFSGGLTSLSFTLNYDTALLRADEVNLNARGAGWGISATQADDGIALNLEGGGVYEDGDIVISLKFMTVAAGVCDFGISGLYGGDGYGNSFLTESAAVDARVSILGAPVPLGDVNGDGNVDNLDAAWVLQYDAKLRPSIENGDVNGDGTVNSVDAALILKYDAGLISGF